MKKILLAAAACAVTSLHAQKTIPGFNPLSEQQERQVEEKFDHELSAQRIGNNIKTMSAVPHNISSPGSKNVAAYVLSQYKAAGFDAKIETYHVLFPTPKTRVLEMTSPRVYKAMLKEMAVPEDATSGQENQLPTYNAWSADGDVTAQLVFVNYGLPEDYEKLATLGIDVNGKIVIAKYGRSWRGIKPKVAQEHGAIGCLIYSDPKDDGYVAGDVYPKGSYKNEYGVQRGSVMDMVLYPGDPLTPGIGATENAKRLSRAEATTILKIPVLPISYHDAQPLLEALEGEVAPADWRGGLPITYHVGPGKATVHLKTEFNWDIVPAYDVVGKLTGSEFPDQWVIRGNHHDAWVNGASDPISGLAAELEEVRALGELVKTGWRPKRTIVYCAWDGEEPGLLGSTEWAEDHAQELKQKGVIYINSDSNGRGYLGASGSHALEGFMTAIAKDVSDPETGVSVFERTRAETMVKAPTAKARKEAAARTDLKLEALGSGSDYSAFLQHDGVPSLDLGYGGEDGGGDYHSIFDSYDHYVRFNDGSFQYGVALARTAGRAVLRMADADLLPFNFTSLYKTVNGYVTELVSLTDQMRETTEAENFVISQNAYKIAADPKFAHKLPVPKSDVPYLNFSPLQNAVHDLDIASTRLETKMANLHGPSASNADFDKRLYRAEQELLSESGLPRRGWYKHTLYAPGFYTGYGVKTLPGIREAIEQRNWTEAQQQVSVVAASIERLANYLTETAK